VISREYSKLRRKEKGKVHKYMEFSNHLRKSILSEKNKPTKEITASYQYQISGKKNKITRYKLTFAMITCFHHSINQLIY